MKKTRWIALLLCLLLLAGGLAGCASGNGGKGAEKAEENDKALELAKSLRVSHSEFFPTILEVKELATPICVIVKKDGATDFLADEALSLAAPEEAKALLLVDLDANKGDDDKPDGSYKCTMTYGTTDAELSVVLDRNVPLEKDVALSTLLNERFSFAEGDAALLEKIRAYEAEIAGRDYLTAINACKDDYGSGYFDLNDVAEPMVYMKDANCVCEGLPGNDFYSDPAEKGQYVPAWDGAYERPEITGDISLGVAAVGKRPDDDGGYYYTLEQAEAAMATMPETFCFSEVVDKEPFGTFSSNSTGESFTAYSYIMRVSTISMDGKLLGYTTLSYEAPDDPLGLNAQIIAMTLSRDKNGDIVFPWGYKDELWK